MSETCTAPPAVLVLVAAADRTVLTLVRAGVLEQLAVLRERGLPIPELEAVLAPPRTLN